MATAKMIQMKSLLALLLAVLLSAPRAKAINVVELPFEAFEEEATGRGERFLLKNSKLVVKSEGGEVRVMRGYYEQAMRGAAGPMHIGFVTMEPNTLFIPQYMDANLIFFVQLGEMKIGWIYKDELVEKTLSTGDIYRIPAGSAFYIVNTGKGQQLRLICSIDTSESLGTDVFQSFYVAGGTHPTSVLAGFGLRTLSTAFNITIDELRPIMERQKEGPIIFTRGSEQQIGRKLFMQLKQQQAIKERKYWAEDEDDEDSETEEETTTWTWRKLLDFVLGKDNRRKGAVQSPDSYNLYNRKPDFRNDYGWSLALDENDYAPLKHSGIGVYLVNLTAGSMMAPHVNPTATEYGVVLRGSGTIQVVYPNGTSAMNAEVTEGSVFWVPRYFPFCQIASQTGPLEFFGFTTSARRNRPQFLAGASSVLRAMSGPEMAAGFGTSEERYEGFAGAQKESIVLPSRHPAEHLPPMEEWSDGNLANVVEVN